MSSFGSISTALTALQAHRRALDVTGHNIANANTPGYTRQRVDLQPIVAPGASSFVANAKLAGSGVEVVGTSRLADEFLTARVRTQTSAHADLQARAETLTQVERLLAEPGENGLAKQLSEMWSAWSNLGNNPDSLAAKTVLLDKSRAVVDAVGSGYRAVEALWVDQRAQAAGLVTEVNTLAAQVADLNDAVLNASKGGAANELLDQRDQLVTRLVELTGASAQPAPGGQVNVYLDGNPLVAGIDSNRVVLTGSSTLAGAGTSPVRLAWAPPGSGDIPLGGGQLAGTFDALNATLPKAAGAYDDIAASLRTAVNGAYATTVTPPATPPLFFAAGGAADDGAVDLKLTVTDPAAISAGNPARGAKDGSVALAVSQLRTSAGGPDALWQRHVVSTGVSVQAATARADVVASSLQVAVSDQQSAVAVSLDEETANLLVVQRAYEGAARVLTAVDQALDTLINRTGLVGR